MRITSLLENKWVRRTRFGLVLLPSYLLAAPEAAGKVVVVADTRRLTGLNAWWATLYNESHLQFTLLTILAIPLAGATLGFVADFLMGRIGIDLKSRQLRES